MTSSLWSKEIMNLMMLGAYYWLFASVWSIFFRNACSAKVREWEIEVLYTEQCESSSSKKMLSTFILMKSPFISAKLGNKDKTSFLKLWSHKKKIACNRSVNCLRVRPCNGCAFIPDRSAESRQVQASLTSMHNQFFFASSVRGEPDSTFSMYTTKI